MGGANVRRANQGRPACGLGGEGALITARGRRRRPPAWPAPKPAGGAQGCERFSAEIDLPF
jgi:hypothetical protein